MSARDPLLILALACAILADALAVATLPPSTWGHASCSAILAADGAP